MAEPDHKKLMPKKRRQRMNNSGERNPMAKLRAEQVRAIYVSDKTLAELAREYKVTYQNIACIVNGQSWRHVTASLHSPRRQVQKNKSKRKLNADQVLAIYNSALTPTQIAAKFDISPSAVVQIRKGQRWSRVTGHQNSDPRLPRKTRS